jgi:hypothetical protein
MRSVMATNILRASIRNLCGLWVPGEMFRKGTMLVVEAHTTAPAGVSVVLLIGGPGPGAGPVGKTLGFTQGADPFSSVNVSRHIAVQQDEGASVNFRAYAGFWNGDGGSDDGTSGIFNPSTATAFIQPLNYVELRTGDATSQFVFASLEVIPGPAAGGLRYQEYLDV